MCNIYDEFSATILTKSVEPLISSAHNYSSGTPSTSSAEQVNNSQVSIDRYARFNSDPEPKQPIDIVICHYYGFGSASIENLMK